MLESALRFHRFHERMNQSIKVQTIGIGLVADEVEGNVEPAALAARLNARTGWLWGGVPDWTDPKRLLEDSRRDLGQAGVARAYSAFDRFVDEMMAEIGRWERFSKNAVLVPEIDRLVPDEDSGDKVAHLYAKLGAERQVSSHTWAVYRYFRLARDCIVHRDGVASSALAEEYRSSRADSELKLWVIKRRWHMPPVLVPVVESEQLEFGLRQVIAASAHLRRIALDLSNAVLRKIGRRGLAYLVAHRAFMSDSPPSEITAAPSMAVAFDWMMSTRHRLPRYTRQEGQQLMAQLDIRTRCEAGFQKLIRGKTAASSPGPFGSAFVAATGARGELPAPATPPVATAPTKIRLVTEIIDEIVDYLVSIGQREALVESDLWTDFLKETVSPAVLPVDGAIFYRGITLSKR